MGVALLASISAGVAGVVDLRLKFGVGLRTSGGSVSGGRGRRSDECNGLVYNEHDRLAIMSDTQSRTSLNDGCETYDAVIKSVFDQQ